MKNLYSLLFFILFLTGCADRNQRMLKEADAVMEENSDSALIILNSIEKSKLSANDIPYYALLKTQAQVKSDISVTSDSLINIAYQKFKGDIFGDKVIRSNFYKGEIYYNQERFKDAMSYYLKAYEGAKYQNNYYWHAKASERIADLYFLAFHYDEAQKYRKEAIVFFKKSGKYKNEKYAIADLAYIYLNQHKPNEAFCLLDSLYEDCKKDESMDRNLLDYIRRPMISALVALGKIDEIDRDDYILLDKKKNSIENNILKSKIKTQFTEANNYDLILDSLSEFATSFDDKCILLYSRYENAKGRGDESLAIQLADSLLYYLNSLVENIITESIAGAQRDFYSSLASHNQEKNKLYLILLILSIIIFVTIGFSLWRYFRLKNLARKADLEASIESFLATKAYAEKLNAEKKLMKEEIQAKEKNVERLEKQILNKQLAIEALEKDINATKSDNNEKSQIFEALFREKWTTLNMLCEEYFEKGDSQKMRHIILNNIEKELQKISSKEGISQIEEAVNKYLDGIIERLREECPFLSEKDISMITLIVSGFSVKSICFLTKIKSGYYYVKKGRIIKKICESNAPNKDLFISRLQ